MKQKIKRRYLVAKCHVMTVVLYNMCMVINRVGRMLEYPEWTLRLFAWAFDWFNAYCVAWGLELVLLDETN